METLTNGRELSGLANVGLERWLKMVLTRVPSREEARMRTTATKRMLERMRLRAFASVSVARRAVAGNR
jgi:hypothetical protein